MHLIARSSERRVRQTKGIIESRGLGVARDGNIDGFVVVRIAEVDLVRSDSKDAASRGPLVSHRGDLTFYLTVFLMKLPDLHVVPASIDDTKAGLVKVNGGSKLGAGDVSEGVEDKTIIQDINRSPEE
jgi:hypothetical protein